MQKEPKKALVQGPSPGSWPGYPAVPLGICNCRSPDFKSPIDPTKNLERLYNRVVVWSVGWSVSRLQRWL